MYTYIGIECFWYMSVILFNISNITRVVVAIAIARVSYAPFHFHFLFNYRKPTQIAALYNPITAPVNLNNKAPIDYIYKKSSPANKDLNCNPYLWW